MEEVVDTQDESEISIFLENSLVGVQTNRKEVNRAPLISTVKTVSSWIIDQVDNEALRKVFATTGLSVASCQSIEQSIDSILNQLAAELQKTEVEKLHNSEVLIQAAFSACRNLPELRLLHTIDYRGPTDEFSLIASWIRGEPIRVLRNDFWADNEGESFSRYLSDRLTYKLPWGINGFLGILAFKLQRQYNDLPIAWQHLPTMMKFGVDSIFACWASSLGITSRGSASELARIYLAEHPSENLDYSDFVRWVVNMPNEYIINDLNISTVEHTRLFKVRNDIVIGDDSLRLLRGEPQEFNSPVRGISYIGGQALYIVAGIREGDRLLLEADMNNTHDPNAVRVSFEGQKIGYVQREKAVLVSKGLLFEKTVTAYASSVATSSQTNPYPSIEMRIRVE